MNNTQSHDSINPNRFAKLSTVIGTSIIDNDNGSSTNYSQILRQTIYDCREKNIKLTVEIMNKI